MPAKVVELAPEPTSAMSPPATNLNDGTGAGFAGGGVCLAACVVVLGSPLTAEWPQPAAATATARAHAPLPHLRLTATAATVPSGSDSTLHVSPGMKTPPGATLHLSYAREGETG
jgi:hypothetical protein